MKSLYAALILSFACFTLQAMDDVMDDALQGTIQLTDEIAPTNDYLGTLKQPSPPTSLSIPTLELRFVEDQQESQETFALIPPPLDTQELTTNHQEIIPHTPSRSLLTTTSVPTSMTSSKTTSPTSSLGTHSNQIQINLREVFFGAPLIYTILFLLSIGTVTLWLYTILGMREDYLMPKEFASRLDQHLEAKDFEAASALCCQQNFLLGSMVRSSLVSRHQGRSLMLENMRAEGKRASNHFWRRLALLNDVAILAPMIGLLGTVLGMFYAFYDINRSVESMNALFDGLGVSVGTTVAGLGLAILAMVFYSTSRYRLIRQLTRVENTAHQLSLKIDSCLSQQETSL